MAAGLPLSDGSGEIIVETTRPETFFGDTAVAVNPEDERYKDMIGKTVLLPIINRAIPIIADEHADPTKGSGAVKITPFHDPNDYEVGQRHDLELVQVIGFDGRMNELAAHFAGMDRYACRKALLQGTRRKRRAARQAGIPMPLVMATVPACPIEADGHQAVVRENGPLAERALVETTEGRVNFHPQRWTKVYSRWLEEVRDWCISRQIWWGHRIPPGTALTAREITVSEDEHPWCLPTAAVTRSNKILTYWTPGSARPCGHLAPWAGQKPAMNWHAIIRPAP